MANTFKLEIVTPERILISGDAIEIIAPGADGELGVLAGHMPLMTSLTPGQVRVAMAGKDTIDRFVIRGGLLHVAPDMTHLLADNAVPVSEIDRPAAQEQLDAARTNLDGAELGSRPYYDALTDIRHAEVLLAASAH